MKKIRLLIVIALSVIMFGPQVSQAQESPSEAPVDIEVSDCPVNVPESRAVDCGYLIVPADYEEPEGDKLRLPYIILRGRSGDPKADPVIFTTGGPGYSSLDSVWSFANSALGEDRDVIIFEQRGNLHAQPNLTCDRSMWWEDSEGNTSCKDSLEEQGIDLTDYTTMNIATDIVHLRKALGYETWNLYGTSYSTTLMLLVMEMDPEGVRSAILQSVRPPHKTTFNHEADHVARSIRLMFDDCEADPACAAAYPDLEGQFRELVGRLNEDPIELEIVDRTSGEPVPLTVDGDLFISWIMVNSFYSPTFLPGKTPYLPLMITETNNGNLGPLSAWLQDYWSGTIDNEHWALGLMMAVNCQEAFPQANPQMSAEDKSASDWLGGFLTNARSREICIAWGLPVEPPPAASPISSEIPTLVLAGSYDPVTPPVWSRETAAALPNSTYVEFGSAGHDVTTNNPCAQQMQVDFIRNPEKRPDDGCMEEVPAAFFVLPTDIYMAPGIYNSVDDVAIGDPRGKAGLEAMAIAGILILLGSLLVLLVGGLVWLVKRRRTPVKASASAVIAYFLAFALAILALALPIFLTMINNYHLNNGHYLARTFGALRETLPATLLAVGAPLMTILALILASMATWAWMKGKWSLPMRLIVTVVVLAALPMVYLGLRWDLYTMLI